MTVNPNAPTCVTETDETTRLIQVGALTALEDVIDQLGRAYRETVTEAQQLPRHQRSRRDYLAGKTAGLSTALNRARTVRDAARTIT